MSSVEIIRICVFVLQVITSIIFIYHERYKTSYILEVVWLAVFIAVNGYDYQVTDVLMYVFEYVSAKLVVILVVYLLRIFSFDLLASATQLNSRKKLSPGMLSKVVFKLLPKRAIMKFASRFWNKVNYGIRICRGNPVMVNKVHSATKVKFDSKGFPVFEKIVTVNIPKKYWKKDRDVHFYQANKILYERLRKSATLKRKFNRRQISELKERQTPSGFTWHHHQERGRLDLVETKIHSKVPHKGGFSIWGKRK